MKVIALVERQKYICEVGHYELEKFLNLYYGKMQELRVGENIDLGKGHNFATEAADALKKTREFIQANQQVVTAILNGLQFSKLESSPPAHTDDSAKERA